MVKHIKLLNGESILGDVISEDPYTLNVMMPMITQVSGTPDGNVFISFLRWLPFSNNDLPVTIHKTSVIIATDVTEDITRNFRDVSRKMKSREEDEELEQVEHNTANKPTDEELAFDTALHQKGIVITSKLKN